MNTAEKPLRLGITMGDPAGVGPELCAHMLVDPQVQSLGKLIVFGDWETLRAAASVCRLELPANRITPAQLQDYPLDQNCVVDFRDVPLEELQRGRISALGGACSYRYLESAIRASLQHRINAIVTAPINKESLNAAGYSYPGHTEILSELTQTSNYGMMLTAPEITCSLVTTHVPLASVSQLLSTEKIVRLIHLSAEALTRIKGRDTVQLVVCGLNPHAGEGGLFGNEESRIIVPAVEQARREGYRVEGPLPPDTAFLPAIRQRTDGYICMYHDQGLIPLKSLAFDQAVNVTLGLPIVRTSVDHGTAFDIAWSNRVQTSSMVAAIRLASQLATGRSSGG